MVKSISIISIVFSCMVGVLHAGNNEELFLRANKLYQAHDYDKALSLYEMIPNKGRAVFYNMGNCYFYKNNYALAMLYWMRAEGGASLQERKDINHNKRCVLEKLGKKTEDTLFDRIVVFLCSITSFVSLFFLQILFLVVWYLGIFFLLRCESRKKKMALVLVTLVSCLGIILFFEYKKRSTQSAFVVVEEVPLLAGPDKGFEKIGVLVSADHVVVKDIRKGWYKVQCFDSIGWVQADAIHIV